MKPTIRVSIGGLAFNLEEDAYHVLDSYLKALRRHFEGNAESDEIISDIELRLSELLQMRVSNVDGVVSMADAQDILAIMGNPKDFDDSVSDAGTATQGSEDHKEKAKAASGSSLGKKLYRDIDNKVIAGVCSGLGHYFRFDVTLVRLIFIILLFSSTFVIGKIGPSMVFVYIVLWIVMPPARTFVQKLTMTGAEPSIENIEDRAQPSSRKYRGSSASNVVGVLVNIVAVFVAVMTMIYIIGVAVSFCWLYFDTDIFGISNYLILTGFYSANLKASIVLATMLPAIGLFALMVKLLKRSAFTTQTLIIFILGFVFWLGALTYLGDQGVKYGNSHRYNVDVVEAIPVNTKADTLYVKIGDEYLNAMSQPNNTAIFYRGEKERDREVCILPEVKIKEDTTLTDIKIEVYKKDFADNEMTAKRKAEALRLDYNLTDSLLTVNPKWYGKDNSWNLEMFKIVISAPRGKKVLVDTPLNEFYSGNITRKHNYGYNIGYSGCPVFQDID